MNIPYFTIRKIADSMCFTVYYIRIVPQLKGRTDSRRYKNVIVRWPDEVKRGPWSNNFSAVDEEVEDIGKKVSDSALLLVQLFSRHPRFQKTKALTVRTMKEESTYARKGIAVFFLL